MSAEPVIRGAFAHLVPDREPTLPELVAEYKASHEALIPAYDCGCEATAVAADNRYFDAQLALIGKLTSMGLTREDARSMAWGIA